MNRSLIALTGLVITLWSTSADAQSVQPPEKAALNRTHVLFQWLPIARTTTYRIVVVEDDRSEDPFDGATPVVELEVSSPMPRTIATEGLAFGSSYAWRVQDANGDPDVWGPTHRFSIIEIPDFVPGWELGGDGVDMQPGLTLFNIRAPGGAFGGGLALAVDAAGEIVWLLHDEDGVGDMRLLPNGHLLYTSAGRGVETTIDGEVIWISPEGINIHHEIFPMPNGNYIGLGNSSQEVETETGTETWFASRIVEFDRLTNEVVFDWNEFDYYSTDDFDEVAGGGDWTHSNAVVYNEADNSLYLSARNLNRITRIDYATGDIVYNMGFDMPSGDVDFGDNLFSFQHAPQLLPNGNMMVFDNGNRRDHIVHTPETGVTKAIELAFTGGPVPTDASIVWEWTLPSYNQALGDADRLPNGNTLVTGGVAGAVYEVGLDGTLHWSLDLEGVFPEFLSYRAERIAALLIPVPPDFNGDGTVDGADLGLLLGAWGDCPDDGPCDADLDNDGDVDGADLGLLLGAWGPA